MASIAHPSAPARPHRRRVALLAATAAAVLLTTLLTGPGLDGRAPAPEAGAQARSVTVSPPNAKAGERVTVSWSGFTAGSTVSVIQCRFTSEPKRWEQCAEPTWTGGVTGPDGRGQVQFLLWQFTFSAPGANPAVFCTSNCEIVVSECDTDFSNGRWGTTPVTVDPGGNNPVGDDEEGGDGEPIGNVIQPTPTAPAAPPPSPTPLAAEGAGRRLALIAGQGFNPAVDQVTRAVAPKGINLETTTKNSPTALDFLINGTDEVALTGRPFSPAQVEQIEAGGEKASDFVYIPVAVSPIAVVHNMDVRGVPIQRFRMSVDTAAKLWQGAIRGVNTPEFPGDNDGCGITTSGATADRSMLGYYRTDRSAANYNFSNWLVTAGLGPNGKPLWPPAPLGSEPPPSPSEDFPSSDESRGRLTNKDLIDFVRDGSPPGSSPNITNASGRLRVGPVDYSEVIALEERTDPKPVDPLKVIRLVQIRNAAGNWALPTSDAVGATLEQSTIGADNIVTVNTKATAPGAYPLLQVYYAAVRRAPNPDTAYDETKAQTSKDFLTYLVSDEGQALLGTRGLLPVTGKLKEIATKEVAALSTTTGATTTTSPPPTVPTTEGGGDFSASDFDASVSDFGSDFSGEDFSTEEDSFGGEEVAGDFSEDFSTEGGEIDGGSEESAAAESEEDGESVVSTPASVLGEAATAPALIALMAIGIAALVAGPALRVYGRRKAAKGVGG